VYWGPVLYVYVGSQSHGRMVPTVDCTARLGTQGSWGPVCDVYVYAGRAPPLPRPRNPPYSQAASLLASWRPASVVAAEAQQAAAKAAAQARDASQAKAARAASQQGGSSRPAAPQAQAQGAPQQGGSSRPPSQAQPASQQQVCVCVVLQE
jgi:hypothetical protein